MLTQLNIKNFAVVQSLDVELTNGLTVITGETGAGKSIMVDALGLVLGDRADNSVVRDGCDRAEISAIFDVTGNTQASSWLEQHELLDSQCIIRRVLSVDGRSRAFINGSPATLQQIRILGESLLDIHSQHEHQSLLKKQTHKQLLDDYAETRELAGKTEACYQLWANAEKQLSELQDRLREQQDQHDLIGYQLEELSTLGLQDGELEQLEMEQVRLANAEQILNTGKQISLICQSSDMGGAGESGQDCASLIAQAIRLSEDLKDKNPELQNCVKLLQDAAIQIDEAQASLDNYLGQVEINPERLQQVEQRLGDAHQLARKHRVQPNELIQKQETLSQQHHQLDHIDEQIQQFTAQKLQTETDYDVLADQLSTTREKAASRLNEQISARLHTLGMPGASFVTQLNPLEKDTPHPGGREGVEFLVSANPGQSPRPLQKVASGGELSRISLAIQVILASKTETPTLIFDEVDVGIGGATAEIVGQLLREIGNRGQVICVTHQPQVAAQANRHLFVSKNIKDESTDSQIRALSAEEKISEVARMLGGVKLTEQTLAHAEEMIEQVAD